MAPITWAHSADRHHVPHEDAVHAIVNAVYFVPRLDEGRTGGMAPDLYIGPGRDGRLLEVMLERVSRTEATVFHVMLARTKIVNEARRRLGR
ncbi:hypothetical protein [Leifsonia sp. SIMBA_070]|uniref:hypothetical protein n=1 Tax=Leifsonia sp. SIMBA_070 TaxID=3085810 RepID=UPI00397A5ABE